MRTAIPHLKPGTILDAGCGDGRNTMSLAATGYFVTAIDQSQFAIDQLRSSVAYKYLAGRIETRLGDVEKLDPCITYDNVLCYMVLHFLQDRKTALAGLQDVTIPGGINIVADFIAEVSPNSDSVGLSCLAKGELKKAYFGWDILHYSEPMRKVRPLSSAAATLYRPSAEIVARKPTDYVP